MEKDLKRKAKEERKEKQANKIRRSLLILMKTSNL